MRNKHKAPRKSSKSTTAATRLRTKARTALRGLRKSSGFMRHPTLVIGGTQHRRASSFKAPQLRLSERMALYREQGIVWVTPSRGMVPTSVVAAWLSLQWPQNHIRSPLIISEAAEVGHAYNGLIEMAMSERILSQMVIAEAAKIFANAPFILTTEEDNIPPQDAVIKLLEAIHTCPDCGSEILAPDWQCTKGHAGYDAVSGLYFIKTDPPIPMAFGDPRKNRGSGKSMHLNFHPQSISAAVKSGKVIEVNGIAMGCALWRKALFRRMPKRTLPWFQTTPNFTQDLYFCKNAKMYADARFGVHCGVRVAHYDPRTKHFF